MLRIQSMGERIQLLIDAAKHLSPSEREELLEALLRMDSDFVREATDVTEWHRRADEARSGTADMVEADDAIAEVRAELEQRRRS